MADAPLPNVGKSVRRVVRGRDVARYPIRTHVVTAADALDALVDRYAQPQLQSGDLLAISERVVAITQGRAFPIRDIHPSRLARMLCRFVFKPSWGIGIGSPWTMELALREAGVMRILVGAVASAMTKPFGLRGVFYRVVGRNIAAIDGPTPYTLPPYNEYAKLPPKDPERVARTLSAHLGVPVAIIDANDIGVSVLGASAGIDRAWIRDVFKDNPLGQTSEQTPLCIVRPGA
jgi:F420-0:gamma-glutamyl ligase-like protein